MATLLTPKMGGHHGLDLWKDSKALLHIDDREEECKKTFIGFDDDEDPWAALPKHLKNKKKSTYIRIHSDLKTASPTTQFILLMWKDYTTAKRRWKSTLIEMFTPVLAVAILTVSVSLWKESEKASTYPSFPIQMPFHVFKDCSRFVFAPNVTLVKMVMTAVQLEFVDGNHTFELTDGDDRFVNNERDDLCAGVVFNLNQANREFPQSIDYKIRFPAVHRLHPTPHTRRHKRWAGSLTEHGTLWQTQDIYPNRLITGPRNENDPTGGSPGYYEEGFLLLQNIIAEKITHYIYVGGMSRLSSRAEAEDSYEKRLGDIFIQLNRFPYPSNKDNDVVAMLHDILPLTIVFAYMLPFMLMIYGCVTEKESGIRIQMKSVEIPIHFHRMAWVIRCLLVHLPPAAISTAILATNWSKHKKDSILTDATNPYVFFLLMAAFIFKMIAFSMFLITFFRRASTATASCGFLWVVSFVPYYYVKSNYNSFRVWQRVLCCCFGNTGIALGFHLVSEGEGRGLGINWNNLFKGGVQAFSIGWVIAVYISVGILELFLAHYVLKIIPEKGVGALPWYFCCKCWYWKEQAPPDQAARLPLHVLQSLSQEERIPTNFEVDDGNVKRRKELQLENVTKYYGAERALHKFNLNCYEGEITAVIGDSGCGKTTLLNLIAGLTPASSGQITVSRQDVSKSPQAASSFVGYCPADDIFYPNLSVEETLSFYCKLKCTASRLIRWDEMNRFVRAAMLEEYREAKAHELTTSGQRVLMVACAFIGGSRVVLLDQPTKHMGAAQKRMTWDLISKQKRHRTVIVAMNSMNECDTIIDKIVYLQNGEAISVGSIRFMQHKFGGGYHLIVMKADDYKGEEVRNLIQHRVGLALMVNESAEELDFFLPEEKTAVFPALFDELELREEEWGIASFHNTYRTMDEVLSNIAKIAMESDYDPEHRKAIYKGVEEIKIDPNYKRLSGFSYHVACFWLLVVKNLRFLTRRKTSLVWTTLAPVLMTVLGLLAIVYTPFQTNPRPITLDLNHSSYEKFEVLLNCQDAVHEGVFLCDSVQSTFSTKYPEAKLKVLYNQTIEDYVLNQYKSHREKDAPLLGVEIKKNNHQKQNVEIVGHFNNQPLHMSPIVLGTIHNSILEYMMTYLTTLYPTYGGFWNYTITVTNSPLPFTPADHIKFAGMFFGPGYFLGIVISLGFAILVSNFVVLEVQEKHFKHLQMLAGANPWSFWAANYLVNFLHFSVGALLVFVAVWGFSSLLNHFGEKDAIILFALLIAYGTSFVFFAGAWSLLPYEGWGIAYSRTLLFHILTGPLLMLLQMALSDPNAHVPPLLLSILENVFIFSPSYSLSIGVFYIFANAVLKDECGKVEEFTVTGACDAKEYKDRLPWNEFERLEGHEALWACCINGRSNNFDILAYGVGQNMSSMCVVLVICFIIRVLKESKAWTCFKQRINRWKIKHSEHHESLDHEIYDYDVLNETLRVHHTEKVASELVIRDLTKEVPGMTKVDHLCIKLERGQCFCLLGASGAGKTATLRMLVGSRMPTGGDVTVEGLSLMNNYPGYIRQFGYCPFESPFLQQLTGLEVIQLIGTLRRIPNVILEGLITNLSLRLLFLHDLDNLIRTYSPNSIRKLSAAVAMIGDPRVVVLDEPTTSIDLISREYLFKSIRNIVNSGSTVVLTSKSVAECEQVCTKMAMMVNGQLRCYGSPKHLRNHYAAGFTIIVRLILDPTKTYFTTRADQYRVHERTPLVDESEAFNTLPEKRYIEETSDRLDDGEIMLFPERAGMTAVHLDEDPEHDLSTTSWEEDLVPFMTYFERYFPGSILVDKQPGFIHYHVRHGFATSSALFETLEQAKVFVAGIENYYIGHANLDQVFINFTRGQKPQD